MVKEYTRIRETFKFYKVSSSKKCYPDLMSRPGLLTYSLDSSMHEENWMLPINYKQQK